MTTTPEHCDTEDKRYLFCRCCREVRTIHHIRVQVHRRGPVMIIACTCGCDPDGIREVQFDISQDVTVWVQPPAAFQVATC